MSGAAQEDLSLSISLKPGCTRCLILCKQWRMAFNRTYLESIETSAPPECGKTLWWEVDEHTGKETPKFWLCRRSTCPICAKLKSSRNARKVLGFLGERELFHLVLTIAPSVHHDDLSSSVDHLFHSFRRMNGRYKLWKTHVIGGVRFFDCAFNYMTQRFNPHFHVIAEMKNSQNLDLDHLWLKVTKTSYVTSQTPIAPTKADREDAVYYATKPAMRAYFNDPAACSELPLILKGRKLSQPFGTWYGKLRMSHQQPLRAGRPLSAILADQARVAATAVLLKR